MLDSVVIGKLPAKAKAALDAYVAEIEERQAQSLFYTLFPEKDTVWGGPSILGGLIEPGQIIHSRACYQKHLEFFEAGLTHRERCFMAANRCITPWTYLETPAGEGLSAEVWTSADADVLSWVDGLKCDVRARDGLFLGIEPAFRLVLDNGQFFDCSRRHRVLTTEGWLSLDLLVSRAGGLRCWYRREDYQASCAEDGYLGGQPLRSVAGIDLSSLLPGADVRARAPLIFERTDEVERRLRHSRACPEPDRLSSRGDLRRFAGLFALFSGVSSVQSALSPSESSRAVARLAESSGLHLRAETGLERDSHVENASPSPGRMLCPCESCTRIMLRAKRQSRARWCDAQGPGGSIQEWSRDAAHIPIFYPSDHPRLVGGRTIFAIVPLGLQPIIDAHVPGTNSYLSAGVVHHNTGKTLSGGGYEMACHLTGLYPEWWIGRRFSHPVSAWAAGDTYLSTRDIVQVALLGEVAFRNNRKVMSGRGVIPGRLLGRMVWHKGVEDLVDTIQVRHVSGGWSLLGFKSYDQGRRVFQGTGRHVIWLDEEPPVGVYGECLMRTATLNGIIMLTFTPLLGMSQVVLSFMPAEQRPDLIDLAA